MSLPPSRINQNPSRLHRTELPRLRAEQESLGKLTVGFSVPGEQEHPALMAIDVDRPLISVQAPDGPSRKNLATYLARQLQQDFGFEEITWLYFQDTGPVEVPLGPGIRAQLLRKPIHFDKVQEQHLSDRSIIVMNPPRSKDFSIGKLWYLMVGILNLAIELGTPVILLSKDLQESAMGHSADGRFISRWDLSTDWIFVEIADRPGAFLMTYRSTGQTQIVEVPLKLLNRAKPGSTPSDMKQGPSR